MCAAAALMIHSSGTLDSVWTMIPAIATLGAQAVSWLFLVSIACSVTAFGLWRFSQWGFLAASFLLMMALIGHFWRAVASADWGRVFIVVSLGVLLGFYMRSRAGFFAHRDL